jgi:hypothetical protein
MARKRAGSVVSVWMTSVVLVAVLDVMLNVPAIRSSGAIYTRVDGNIN